MKNGGIGQLIYADGEEMTILGCFTRMRLRVYGLPEAAAPAGS